MIQARIQKNTKGGFTPTPVLASVRLFKKVSQYRLFRVSSSAKRDEYLAKQKAMPKQVSGFTLVEMMVSVAVFMSVMTVAVSSLTSIINANKKAQSMKSLTDNLTFAIDSMSRNMRIGTNYACRDDSGSFAPTCPLGSKEVLYLPAGMNPSGSNYVVYRFVQTDGVAPGEGNIQERRGCNQLGESCTTNAWQSLTAPTTNINVTNMTFYVLGNGADSQPRAIITAQGVVIAKNNDRTEFTLQTTASQRKRSTNN